MNSQSKKIIGQSTSLKAVFAMLAKVAPTDSTVLVTGESGTGKELLVRALHAESLRNDKPFVPVNCGAIPRELLESELFGHEKGAFTHALRTRQGRFELADGGTIFLDEIGEMELSLQVKILRVLQEREIERVGGTGCKKIDVRIITATNRDLEKEVANGNFREDLFYRLNVIPMHLPALRERDNDILELAEYFLDIFCLRKKRETLSISPDARKVLTAYPWPGNVRELENFMERLSILAEGPFIVISDLPQKILDMVGDLDLLPEIKEQIATSHAFTPATHSLPASVQRAAPTGFSWPTLNDMQKHTPALKDFLEIIENKLIDEALERVDGVKNQAAELLGIKRTTLIEKLRKKNG